MPGAERGRGGGVQGPAQEPCLGSWGNLLTIHDDLIGDAELGLHQRGLLLPPPRPGPSGPGLRVGLDHEGFLPLPPLLLLQQRPLQGGKGRHDSFSRTFWAQAGPVLDPSGRVNHPPHTHTFSSPVPACWLGQLEGSAGGGAQIRAFITRLSWRPHTESLEPICISTRPTRASRTLEGGSSGNGSAG